MTHRNSAIHPRSRAATGWIGVVLWLGGCGHQAPGLSVAAAADLKFAMDEMVQEFHAANPGMKVSVTYGSSGNFYAQIRNRAPFDLYFSADAAYPRQLGEAGYALDDDVFPYAIGRLAAWVPASSQLDVETMGLEALLAPSVRKIAIANPRHAPYGVAAVEAMESAGVHDRIEPKLVFGENVAQAAQFVQTGAADIGIIALSLAVAPEMRDTGRHWEIPEDAHRRLDQAGIVLNRTKDAAAARAFRDFVLGAYGRAVLERHGFQLPES